MIVCQKKYHLEFESNHNAVSRIVNKMFRLGGVKIIVSCLSIIILESKKHNRIPDIHTKLILCQVISPFIGYFIPDLMMKVSDIGI
jgi:hypothetical protein